MTINRRKFIGSSAAIAAGTMIPAGIFAKAPASSKSSAPNSKFGGVQIGAITYSWRSMPGGVENVIKYCKEANLSSIELMSTDLEDFLGAPKNPMQGMFAAPQGPRP
ncbi:MAG TPA: sugar phosphate isomerase/epimerase, partial [Bacteroidales bacterium]|nr:sugar phosphate isomerase/epimerase [Bacteroidales bacterium]